MSALGQAGAEFNLSATNTTQRIKTLEADLGVKLFNRTTRAVSLTPDGEVFREYARRVLDEVAHARLVLSKLAQAVSVQLRVTASASLCRSHVVPFVQEFLEKYPDVTLDLN